MKASTIFIGMLSIAACAAWEDGPSRNEPLSRIEFEDDSDFEAPAIDPFFEGDIAPEDEEVIYEVMRSKAEDAESDSEEPMASSPVGDPDLDIDTEKPLLVPSQEGIIVTRF